MYGRLRMLARVLQGRCGRVISVGGVPVYRGYARPTTVFPVGLPVPTREDAPKAGPDEVGKVLRIIEDRGRRLRVSPDGRPLPLSPDLRTGPAVAARVADRSAHPRRPGTRHRARRGAVAAHGRLRGERGARAAPGGRPARRLIRPRLQRRRRDGSHGQAGRRDHRARTRPPARDRRDAARPGPAHAGPALELVDDPPRDRTSPPCATSSATATSFPPPRHWPGRPAGSSRILPSPEGGRSAACRTPSTTTGRTASSRRGAPRRPASARSRNRSTTASVTGTPTDVAARRTTPASGNGGRLPLLDPGPQHHPERPGRPVLPMELKVDSD